MYIKVSILLLLIVSNYQTEHSAKTIKDSLSENWTIFQTKESIPYLLNEVLKRSTTDDFWIANQNEKYNATDVVFDSIPSKQLRLLARKKELWRLTYLQGGFGTHYVYVECKIKKDTIYDYKTSTSILKLETNDSIDKFIEQQKLKPKSIKILMH